MMLNLMMIIFACSGAVFVQSKVDLRTSFSSTRVQEHGRIEWVIQRYQPPNPESLTCRAKNNGATVILAKLQNGAMQLSPDAILRPWGFNGRVSIKNKFTIVIAGITLRENGYIFECVVINGFEKKPVSYTLEVVRGFENESSTEAQVIFVKSTDSLFSVSLIISES